MVSTGDPIALSRIFIKGLPPTLSENDFKKHFSSGGREITEARLFPNRRIGYVGYKTNEDALSAVKYFNKTFVRMSRIGVEIARPPRAQFATTQAADKPAEYASSDKSKLQDAVTEPQADDAKLKEFLDVMRPKSRKRAWESDVSPEENATGANTIAVAQHDADDSDYDDLPQKAKKQRHAPPTPTSIDEQAISTEDSFTAPLIPPNSESDQQQGDEPTSDEAWARSRTSRLLGLINEDDKDEEEMGSVVPTHRTDVGIPGDADQVQPASPIDDAEEAVIQPVSGASNGAAEQIRESMRLFIRNLSYDTTNENLESEFTPFGHLEEVHVATSKKTGLGKGFAYLQFTDPEAAVSAYKARDGQIFQGRLLHILPAAAKRETRLNEYDLSKLPLKKQQQIQRRREAASTHFNWNTLYMNPDAVVSSVAAQLGVAKSTILDPTSSDAAVKQAHAETHVIQETKSYFREQGVDLDAFKRSQRGDTVILVKNMPFDASRDDLRRLFEEHGEIRRFLMPPSGVIAIIEMSNAVQAQTAFGALAYKRLKSSMLFLEKGPKDLFTGKEAKASSALDGKEALSTADLKIADTDDSIVKPTAGTATLFVRNLNFETTDHQFSEAFSPLTGFLSAKVKTKTDPKKPGQILSMGFGFVEFRNSSDAQAALRTMDGSTLQGHKLQVRASNKGVDAAEERRRAGRGKREAGQRTKIIIKNLPFEVGKKDIRALFSAYGQLRSVRVPKKMDRAARGFAFADFTTPKEAQSAMEALRDTHLLGRRLVLDFADEETADAEEEIERMAAKVGGQTNAVAVQRLTGQGRKKFTTRRDDDEET